MGQKQADHLLRDKGFLAILIIGGVLTTLITGAIVFNDLRHLDWDCTAAGFETLYQALKFPIGCATATITLLGVWALVFRSQQTAKQIDEAQKQNTFANYYKHKEEFIKSYQTQCEQKGLAVYSLESLYHKIYPNNSPTVFQVKASNNSDTYLGNLITEYNALSSEALALGEKFDIQTLDLIPGMRESLMQWSFKVIGILHRMNFSFTLISGGWCSYKIQFVNNDKAHSFTIPDMFGHLLFLLEDLLRICSVDEELASTFITSEHYGALCRYWKAISGTPLTHLPAAPAIQPPV